MMTDLQAIQQRTSRRTYTGGVPGQHWPRFQKLCAALSEKHGVYLAFVADAAATFGGFTKSYGMFTGVRALFLLARKPGDNNGPEKLGNTGETLVLEATKLGLGTCWVGGTFNKAAVQNTLPDGFVVEAVITVGEVAGTMQGKEKLIYRMAHRGGKTPEEMSRIKGTAPDWFHAGMQAVAKAPSAVNRQPVVFTWDGETATARVDSDKAMQQIDLGIAKLHFELAAGGTFALGNGGAFAKE